MAKVGTGNNQSLNIAIVIGIVVLGVATLAALVIDESGRVTSALGFLTGLVALLGGALKLGAIEKVSQMAALQSAAAVSTTAETGARVDAVSAKVDVVHEAVNGLNKAALENQAIISDRAGFDRGVSEMTQVADAKAGVPPPEVILTQEVRTDDPRYVKPSPPVEDKPTARYQPPKR